MATKIVLVLCFALFAAAVAKSDKVRYTNDQTDKINDRIAACVQPLPAVPPGGIERPSNTCRWEAGMDKINSNVATKDEIAEPICKCLKQKGIPAGPALEKACACLKKELAKPL